MEINTFLASLPEDWSDFLTAAQVQSYITVFGPTASRTKIVSYIEARKNLVQNLGLQAVKKMYTPTVDPRTVYYNSRPPKAVSVSDKKTAKAKPHVIFDDS